MSAPLSLLTPPVRARAVLIDVAARGTDLRWEIIWDGPRGAVSSGQRYTLAAARALAIECGAVEIEERGRDSLPSE